MSGNSANASLEAILKELKSIESQVESPEKKEILRVAGMSLLFICAKDRWQDFRQFLLQSDTPLSAEQIRHLRLLGIQA